MRRAAESSPMSEKRTSREFTGENAWQNLLGHSGSRWLQSLDRFDEDVVPIEFQPKFSLDAGDTFFCIGSCFARNIEEKLIYAGIDVLSKRIKCPQAEYPLRPNGSVNKFTTHSIRNELAWQVDRPLIDETLFEQRADGWYDLQLSPGVRPVSLDRAIERRRYLIDEYFDRIRMASVVIITLGLNEVWFDELSGRFLNAAPSIYAIRRTPGRYRLRTTDVAQNVRELEAIAELIFQLNSRAKILVTVSPVPMGESFSGRDVVVANTASKATLRAAAEVICAAHPQIDYYPSFEMISASVRTRVYEIDNMHVTEEAVSVVIRRFLRSYLEIDAPEVEFIEMPYLTANPDVDEAVRRGEFGSGFEHWQRHGQSEGRPLVPPGGYVSPLESLVRR